MDSRICVTCGTQYSPGQAPLECPICLDQRQYVRHDGQKWTTIASMQANGYHNVIREQEPRLIGIGTEPSFAIGQRALLVQTGQGNVLWDCISLLDENTVAAVQQLGGIKAIAISHPHFYTSVYASQGSGSGKRIKACKAGSLTRMSYVEPSLGLVG
jgi:hypothetical protein